MSRNLKMPWSMEDTIENMKHIRDIMIKKVRQVNYNRKAEEDVREINFDFNRAITALEEIKQYRAIGTVEECREAVEKQRAKKPIIYCGTNRADCPNCGNTVRGIKGPFGNWCSNCGKKLDWSE